MHGANDRQAVPNDWLTAPSEGALFAGQTLASGKVAPDNATCKRIVITSAGDLYLIPIGLPSLVDGASFGSVVAGQQIDQQCIGIGNDNSAGVTVQFN
jgi:hypothetical protein